MRRDSCQRKDSACHMSRRFAGFLHHAELWMTLAIIRSDTVKKIQDCLSQVFRNMLRLMFGVGSPYNFKLGIYFAQLSRPLQCQLGFIVSDEQALKVMLQFKGSSGTMCCALCRNCVLLSSELDKQDRSLRNFAQHRLSRFTKHTDATVFESVDYLSRQRGRVTKKDFKVMTQSLGFNHCTHGILQDVALREFVKPAGNLMYDWMHCVLVQGVFPLEVNLMLQSLKFAGFSEETLATFIDSCAFPSYIAGKSVSGQGVLNRKTDGFHPSASEALSVYPVIRLFAQNLLPTCNDQTFKDMVISFFALCDFLDLLVGTMANRPDATADKLSFAASEHLRLFVKAHGAESVIPKHLYSLHMGDFMRRHDMLVNCFTHERHHKDVKKFANASSNVGPFFEMTLMKEMLVLQLHQMESFAFHREQTLFFVEAVKPAPRLVADEIKTMFNQVDLEVNTSLSISLMSGRTCRKGDVIILLDNNVGEVLVHVHAGGQYLSLISLWESLGSNKFKTTRRNAEWRESHTIQGCLIYLKDGDNVTVVPQEF